MMMMVATMMAAMMIVLLIAISRPRHSGTVLINRAVHCVNIAMRMSIRTVR
jgi:hypothetical protein